MLALGFHYLLFWFFWFIKSAKEKICIFDYFKEPQTKLINMGVIKKTEFAFEALLNKIDEKPWYFLTIIVFLNIVLKSFNLYDASLWLDEASQINLSLKSIKEIINESLIYPNAPFYTILLSFWIEIFGIMHLVVCFHFSLSFVCVFVLGFRIYLPILIKKNQGKTMNVTPSISSVFNFPFEIQS